MGRLRWALGLGASLCTVQACARSTVDLSTDASVAPLHASDAGALHEDGGAMGGEDDDAGAPHSGADAGASAMQDGGGHTSSGTGHAGFYAARRVYQQTQSISGSFGGIPVKGNLLNTHTIYSLITIGADGSYTERVCGADIKSKDADGASGLFESGIELNPAIFDHLEPVKHAISFTDKGWSVAPLFMPVGWKASSSSDPIPTDAMDARVFDLDMDTHPGVTVKLSGNVFASGELYAVQSVRYSVEGTFDGDMLVGQDFDMGEQVVLGGTIVDTKQRVQAAGDSSTNRMHLVKRSDNSLTCKQLVADPAIFPPHPVFM